MNKKLHSAIFFALFAVLLFGYGIPAFAQDSNDNNNDNTKSVFAINLQYVVSFTSNNVCGGLSYLSYYKWLGIGGGAEVFYGISCNDLYAMGYFRLALATFYIDVGVFTWIMRTTRIDIASVEGAFVVPYARLGLDIPMFKKEHGGWALYLSLAYLFTDMPLLPTTGDSLFSGLGAGIATVLFCPFKLGCGISVNL